MNGITSVTLERGMCFGECPVYRVTLRRDGRANWLGWTFVDRLGRWRGRIGDRARFDRLASLIERSGFFTWDDDYPPRATCIPDYELTVRHIDGGKRVRVWADSPQPREFERIAGLVDALARRIDWEPADRRTQSSSSTTSADT